MKGGRAHEKIKLICLEAMGTWQRLLFCRGRRDGLSVMNFKANKQIRGIEKIMKENGLFFEFIFILLEHQSFLLQGQMIYYFQIR